MWRQLLASTDPVGRVFVTVAAISLVASVVVFLGGIGEVIAGHARLTLPFWIGTMGCAILAGALIYAASRRGNTAR